MQLLPEPETSLDISTIFISLAAGGMAGVLVRPLVRRLDSLRVPVVAIVGALGGMAGGRLVGPYLSDIVGSMTVGLVLGAAIGAVVVVAVIAGLRKRETAAERRL